MASEYSIDFNGSLEKCNILIDNMPLFNTNFIDKNCRILARSVLSSEIQRNLFLHPCTNELFIKFLVYYAFSVFIKNSNNDEDFINNLIPGDMVINMADNRRYKVSEIDTLNGYLVLEASYGTLRLPINQRTNKKIRPYYGKATALDGRGIRKQGLLCKGFFSKIFNIDANLIGSTIDYSIVVVCPKYEADFIMESVLLSTQYKKLVKIGDLFPAAYYSSSSDSHNYAGNSANVEPVIKFTNRISTARELVLDDDCKRILGVLINGSDYIFSNLSELNDILVRKSLHSVTMISPIMIGDYRELLIRYSDINLYAWTEKALLSTIVDLCHEYKDYNLYGNIVTLYKRLNYFCDREVTSIIIESPFDADIWNICKNSLYKLKNLLPDGEDKNYFLLYGFSLLKLIGQSCFALSKLERMLSEHSVTAISPNEILHGLEVLAHKYFLANKNIYNEMKIVCEALEMMKNAILYINPKFEYLKKALLSFCKNNIEAIAVVFPKNYYCKVFWECLRPDEKNMLLKCTLTTPNKYDFGALYKKIYILSLPESPKFNATILSNTNDVEYVCYLHEKWRIETLNEKTIKMIKAYDRYNKIEYDFTEFEENSTTNVGESHQLEKDLESYIDQIIFNAKSATIGRMMESAVVSTEVVKMVIFETGECAFLTKYYTPYIYNRITETVEEVDVDSIMVGDTLVFTNIDDENKDIVDKVLVKFINSSQENQIIKEAYRKSKHWKFALKEYMQTNGLTYHELSQRLQYNGKSRHEVTLRTWLEEGSRIVGPRDVDSFYSIALLTNDKEMIDNPDSFYEACCEIRSLRIQILKYIGKAIVHAVVSEHNAFGNNLAMFAEDISKMAQMLQIDRIENINTLIPIHMANKPQFVG